MEIQTVFFVDVCLLFSVLVFCLVFHGFSLLICFVLRFAVVPLFGLFCCLYMFFNVCFAVFQCLLMSLNVFGWFCLVGESIDGLWLVDRGD